MTRSPLAVFILYILAGGQAVAYDVSERFSVGGVLAGAVQCQVLEGSDVSTLDKSRQAGDQCRGAVPFRPEFSFQPNDRHGVRVKLGFSAGNALNPDTVRPFNFEPWAADLEDDVKNINGRGRDYLLTAWYKYTAKLSGGSRVGIAAGLIDATEYLDQNKYSNDEYTQFMNPALVNAPNGFLPSYDIGAGMGWQNERWSVRSVYMNIGENDDGNNVNYFGVQFGHRVQPALGEGTYRIIVAGTGRQFLDPARTSKERRTEVILSLDQELGKVFGIFLRIGVQDDKAAIDYRHLYSGGLNILGSPWKRPDDNIGVGYAYLDGGNLEINDSQVAEAYYRFAVNDVLGVTGDVQYMKDEYKTDRTSPQGWILGLRVAAEF